MKLNKTFYTLLWLIQPRDNLLSHLCPGYETAYLVQIVILFYSWFRSSIQLYCISKAWPFNGSYKLVLHCNCSKLSRLYFDFCIFTFIDISNCANKEFPYFALKFQWRNMGFKIERELISISFVFLMNSLTPCSCLDTA